MKASVHRRVYEQPPLIEALCEIYFTSAKPWDVTVHGIAYEKVQKEFPLKKNIPTLSLELRPTPSGVEQKVGPATPRTHFFSKDEKRVIQLAPNLLVVNQLKPYTSWDKFKPMILDAFRVYDEVAQPDAIQRVGLRYINSVEFKAEPVELEQYFNFYPHLAPGLPQSHGPFACRVEIPYSGEKDQLIVTLASTEPGTPDVIPIALDLYYVLVNPEGFAKTSLPDWIENAHSVVETAFEACTTDKCKDLFGGGR